MKGLKIKIQALLLCGVLITGLFSSCASDENIDNGNKVNAGDKVLTLTLNTPKATTTSGAKTRADGTNMTDANITASGTEDQINLLTIGIFNSTGDKKVRTIQELKAGTSLGSFSTDVSKKTTATLVTNSLANGDDICVAVNAPSGTFNGCTTVAEFEARTIAVDAANGADGKSRAALVTSADGTSPSSSSEATDNIPMYGTGSITASGTTYTSSVAVKHQLAKITVALVMVDFDQTGPYKSATFQPTSFFLLNVPNTLAFSNDAWTGSTDFWHGWADADATTTTPTTSTLKKCLGTGTFSTPYTPLKYSTSSSDNTIKPGTVFYTMPNSNTSSNTKLVIGGLFDADGNGTAASPITVYYPVNINWVYDKNKTPTEGPADGTTDAKKVYPNKNYKCSVIIKTKGATSPSDKIDPEVASITVTVTPFDTPTQETTFE